MSEADSIIQAITDPENQPSQYGTVTIDYHLERMAHYERIVERQFAIIERQSVELMKEREGGNDA